MYRCTGFCQLSIQQVDRIRLFVVCCWIYRLKIIINKYGFVRRQFLVLNSLLSIQKRSLTGSMHTRAINGDPNYNSSRVDPIDYGTQPICLIIISPILNACGNWPVLRLRRLELWEASWHRHVTLTVSEGVFPVFGVIFPCILLRQPCRRATKFYL